MATSSGKTGVPRRLADFELGEMLGQGGMGSVFKARQMSLDRVVAVKILSPSLAQDKQFILRFQREARLSGRLDHPNIVQGIDVGQDAASGFWYFAMEFVDGPTLKNVIKKDGRLSEERAIEIGIAIASALETAARQDIVHRDIKPENILLDPDGNPKLADLGLAKPVASNESALTQSGVAVGTPYFMAPEQIRGLEDEVDSRTDIYALGSTLFCLVTGVPPFDGESDVVVMAKHLKDKPPLAHKVVSTISSEFGKICGKAMQKEPAKRFQSPSEFRAALEQLRDHGPAPAQRTGSVARGTRTVGGRGDTSEVRRRSDMRRASGLHSGASERRRRIEAGRSRNERQKGGLWLFLCGALACAGLLIWFISNRGEDRPAPRTAERPVERKPQPPPVPKKENAPPVQPVTEPVAKKDKGASRHTPPEPAPKGAAVELGTKPVLPGLLAHWSFDTGNASQIHDESGNGYDLTARGHMERVDARGGKALRLVRRQEARIVSAKRFELGPADFTIAAWIKTSTGGCILCESPGDGWQRNGKIFYVDGRGGPKGAVRFDSHSVGCESGRTSLLDNRWHHVAVTFTRATQHVRLYVDGREDGHGKLKLRPVPSGFQIRLGWGPKNSFTSVYDGLVDDVQVYSRVLSASDIQKLAVTSAP